MATDDGVEILPDDHLGSDILRLHIAKCDGHDTTMSGVVDVAAYGGPLFDPFNMVKHKLCVLEVSTRLHALDEVNSATRPTSDILNTKTLSDCNP